MAAVVVSDVAGPNPFASLADRYPRAWTCLQTVTDACAADGGRHPLRLPDAPIPELPAGDDVVPTTARQQTDNQDAMLDVTALSMADDPTWNDGYYLSINGPRPGGLDPCGWNVHLGWWEPEDPDDEDNGNATGTEVVTCDLPTAPAITDLVQLLNLSAAGPSQHKAWAATPVGAAFTGTGFTVTSRDDTHR